MFKPYPRDIRVNPFTDFGVGDYTHVKSDQMHRARGRIRTAKKKCGYAFKTSRIDATTYEVRRVPAVERTPEGIDKGVPVPPGNERPQSRTYPFAAMEVGDSVAFDADDITRADWAARREGQRKGRKFTRRKVGPGLYRIWRIA